MPLKYSLQHSFVHPNNRHILYHHWQRDHLRWLLVNAQSRRTSGKGTTNRMNEENEAESIDPSIKSINQPIHQWNYELRLQHYRMVTHKSCDEKPGFNWASPSAEFLLESSILGKLPRITVAYSTYAFFECPASRTGLLVLLINILPALDRFSFDERGLVLEGDMVIDEGNGSGEISERDNLRRKTNYFPHQRGGKRCIRAWGSGGGVRHHDPVWRLGESLCRNHKLERKH